MAFTAPMYVFLFHISVTQKSLVLDFLTLDVFYLFDCILDTKFKYYIIILKRIVIKRI